MIRRRVYYRTPGRWTHDPHWGQANWCRRLCHRSTTDRRAVCTHTNPIAHVLIYEIDDGLSGEHQNQPDMKYGELYRRRHRAHAKGGSKLVALYNSCVPYGGHDSGGKIVCAVFLTTTHSRFNRELNMGTEKRLSSVEHIIVGFDGSSIAL